MRPPPPPRRWGGGGGGGGAVGPALAPPGRGTRRRRGGCPASPRSTGRSWTRYLDIYNIYIISILYIPDQAAELLGARELSPKQLVAWIEGKRGEASTARPR